MGGGDSHTLIRLALMGLSYLAYFMTFGALTLFASAKLSSSRGALVALVGLWGLFTLVIPRVATEVSIGVQLYQVELSSLGRLALHSRTVSMAK